MHSVHHNPADVVPTNARARVSNPADSALPDPSKTSLGNTKSSLNSEVKGGENSGKYLAILAQKSLGKYSEFKALRECHRAPRPGSAAIGFDSTGGVIGLCNSRSRLSPMAAADIFHEDSLQMTASVKAWSRDSREHDVAMMTLTVPHYAGDSLEWLLGAFQRAWAKFTHNAVRGAWRRVSTRYGIRTWHWTMESPHSFKNGHHPHRHVLLFLDRRLSSEERADLERELYRMWLRSVESVMGRRPSEEHGLDLRLASRNGANGLAQYVTKGMALEATGGIWKSARAGSRTFHELLVDLALHPRARDLALFHEMERALSGAHWKGCARSFWEVMRAAGYEEVREELEGKLRESGELAMERYVLLSISRADWMEVRDNVERRMEIRRVTCEAGPEPLDRYEALAALLESWGIKTRRVMVPIEHYGTLTPSAANSRALAADARGVVPGACLPVPGGAAYIPE